MSRQRLTFKCCGADCPVGHFQATIDLSGNATAIVHCPFCHAQCLTGPLRGPEEVTRGGGAFDGLPREPRSDERIPTRPLAADKDDPE